MTVRVRLEDLKGTLRARVDALLTKPSTDPRSFPVQAPIAPKATSKWKARPESRDGIRFDSGLEARVYSRLVSEIPEGTRLFTHVRLPLWNLEPQSGRTPLYLKVDFAFVSDLGKLVRLVDAKPKRWKSRDWRRGKAAAEACYGIRIEEASA